MRAVERCRKVLEALLLAALACAGVARAQGAASSPAAEARRDEVVAKWMHALHRDWAMPRYAQLHQRAQSLDAAVGRACGAAAASATRGKALAAAQAGWREAMRVWRELEALQLGPTLARRTSKTIDFWPTRPNVIEKAAGMTAQLPVSGAEADQAMLQWGTAAKGLPALEWLLFPAGEEASPVQRDAALCRFAQRVSLALLQETTLLLPAWQEETQRWGSAQPPSVQKTLSDALNLFVGSVELLRGKKLAKGAEAQAARARGAPDGRPGRRWLDIRTLDAFDSVRSGMTREYLLVHYDALAQLLLGRTPGLEFTRGGPAQGLDDVLVQMGRAAEAQALAPAVRRARQAIRALPRDPRAWTPAAVVPAADALAGLRAALDPAVAQVFHVTITFTDADGD